MKIIEGSETVNLIKKVLFGTAVFALSINFLFLLVPLFISPEDSYIDFVQFIVILIFSFVISLANRIFDAKKLHISLKILIHFVALTASFIILFSSWNPSAFSKPSAYFVAFFLFAIAYGIVFAGVAIGKKIYAKARTKSKKIPTTTKDVLFVMTTKYIVLQYSCHKKRSYVWI